MKFNPLASYRRWRHSRGFGVHSPWAYGVVSEVLRSNDRYGYYAWDSIDRTFGQHSRLARKVYALIVHLQPSTVTVAGDPLWHALAVTACDAPGANGPMLLVADPAAYRSDDGFETIVLTCLDTPAGRELWNKLCAAGGLAIDTHRHLGILGRRPDLPGQVIDLRTALPSQ